MTTRESELHSALIRHVVERGFAPPTRLLAEQLGWSESELQGILKQLAAIRGVILKPNSFEVWAIHPFTLMPYNPCGGIVFFSNFRLTIGARDMDFPEER